MTKKQKTLLESRFKRFHVPGWEELLVKLKAHGGEMMVPLPQEKEYVDAMLREGGIFDTAKLKIQRGKPGKCHENASRIWAEADNLELCTGYALTADDGLWRQHSWVFNPGAGELIETTGVREKYFGVALDPMSAFAFAKETVPEYQNLKMTPFPMMLRLIRVYARYTGNKLLLKKLQQIDGLDSKKKAKPTK